MEKREALGTCIYVTKMPVSPSAIGIFRPKIIMPEVILKKYDQEDLQTILLHEKTHIQLGHLLFYFLWDILRITLWLNPFLTIGTRYSAEKKEELAETLEEKKEAKEDDADGKVKEKSTPNKAKQLLNEKLAASKDGMIYLNDTDIRTIIEVSKEDNTGKANTKQQAGVGANLDLKA